MRRLTAVRVISFLCAGIVALGGWALGASARAKAEERARLYAADRAFGELATSLSELDAALEKSLYACSSAMAGALCTQVYGKAQTAQQALGALPYSSEELEKTAGFLSRVGDYAYMLARAAARGEGYTDGQRENLAALADVSGVLAENLRSLRAELADGRLTFDEQRRAEQRADEAEAALPATLSEGMRLTEQEFPELPALIYDGPFSAHLDRAEPLALRYLPEFSEEEARTQARALLGGGAALRSLGRSEGKLPTWDFSARAGDGTETTLSLSVRGGKPVLLLVSRAVGERVFAVDEALEKARQYVKLYGFSDMISSYHMVQGGVMTVNFAYAQDGVVCWADLVKVGVALDDGSLVSLEARGWLMNHRTREIPAPAVSEEEAAAQVGPGLEIESSRLALVPRAGGDEVFCREFTCVNAEGRHYVVCVDALTGEQEKILILLEDENGSLTI